MGEEEGATLTSPELFSRPLFNDPERISSSLRAMMFAKVRLQHLEENWEAHKWIALLWHVLMKII